MSSADPDLIAPSDDLDFPVSFSQQRLWFLHQFDPDGGAYNRPTNFRLVGPLQATVLQNCLQEIVRRHESLRTRFPVADGQPVQRVVAATHVPLEFVDLSHLPEPERLARCRRLAREEVWQRFDLQTEPPLRCTLVRLRDEEHVLLVTVHHLVFDGWSEEVFLRELRLLYDAFSSGKPSPLTELPIQYADYAVWQLEQWNEKAMQEQKAYWKAKLEGVESGTVLLTDHQRLPLQRFRGRRQSVAIPREIYEKLTDIARRERATKFMALLAVLKTLLFRYTGDKEIVLGSPIAGRNHASLENLIGCFVNTLVLRTDLSGNPSFRELVARVRDVTVEAYDHQEFPFEQVVRELAPTRDPDRSALFQMMFQLRGASDCSAQDSVLRIEPLEMDSGIAQFDLSFDLLETADGLCCRVDYNTDLFEEETVVRMLGHFEVLSEACASAPDEPIGRLPLLTVAQRKQILVDWNRTESELPPYATVHRMFEAQVERTPDAVAVAFENRTLSYRELNAKANQLARQLRELGVGPETLVGIFVERSLEMMVGLFGILKAGGAYVPLDPNYPEKRLEFILQDADVSVLVSQRRLLQRLPRHSACVVCLDANLDVAAKYPETNLPKITTSNHLAYVIYTSGSTGRPKGVLIEHGGVVNFLDDHARQLGTSPGDSYLAQATLCFDASVLDLFMPLIVGAKVVVVGEEASVSGWALAEILDREKPTYMCATPSLWRILLETGWEPHPELTIICGAEALDAELAARLMARGNPLWNAYGPTEATVDASIHRITDPSVITIGRPMSNTQMYILDRQGQPAPVGVPGELHVGGMGVARGYLNQPELTAERFVADPFSGNSSSRLYKTGDLARYSPDGAVEFLGRLDHQVKVRGFRIEPEEIEMALADHPHVRRSVVTVWDQGPDDRRLVAHFVPEAGSAPAASDLRHFLEQKLPAYMVPTALVRLDAIPLMPNGKVDRKALSRPSVRDIRTEDEAVMPRSPVEQAIADIWCEVLKLDRVGVHDDFFEVGGHSLTATQVAARLRCRFQAEVSLRQLFQARTIASLAKLIDTGAKTANVDEGPSILAIREQRRRLKKSA